MKKWFPEDWLFRIEVVRVGKENKAEECRLGLEPGDTFECTYGTPQGFCPTSFIKIFPSMEVTRCSGNLRRLGENAYPRQRLFVLMVSFYSGSRVRRCQYQISRIEAHRAG